MGSLMAPCLRNTEFMLPSVDVVDSDGVCKSVCLLLT